MRIGVLTSSRADLGIYLPLVKLLLADNYFEVKIIAFGTHVSSFHGHTLKDIEELGCIIDYKVESLVLGDSVEGNATATALTAMKFSSFWAEHANEFDLVFCVGDRFEMYSAVLAGIPFRIRFAHIHGGEKTLGAIDDIYRHSITHASWIHFTANEAFSKRVEQLIDTDYNIFTVGALSLDNLHNMDLLSLESFKDKWSLDIKRPFVLVTFHPETVSYEMNETYIYEVVDTVKELSKNYDIVITMPNVDAFGSMIRQVYKTEIQNMSGIFFVENFGTQSYYTAMKNAAFLLGNTSSGIIEAASLNKYVINIGDRQKGRLAGENVYHAPVEKKCILELAQIIKNQSNRIFENPYGDGRAAHRIINILKSL